jgi:hypothetical protein
LKLKTKLGLDDVLTFGKYHGHKVEDIVNDSPHYISWLIQNTDTKFYESVHERMYSALAKYVPKGPVGPWVYSGENNLYANGLSSDDFTNWIEDVPF